jgi:hypothetical protein
MASGLWYPNKTRTCPSRKMSKPLLEGTAIDQTSR